MIQIAGVPFQLNDNWELGTIEKSIIEHMLRAPIVYSFHSTVNLLFEVKVRKNIIDSSVAMSESEAAFTIFEHAACNPRFWHLTPQGGFLLRADVQPADAVLDIYRNSAQYAFECATAAVIVLYHAVLQSINRDLFNSLFQNLYLYSWNTDPDLRLVTFYSDHLLPGDVVYINNPDFNTNTPWLRGLNAVLLNDGTFFGHGFDIRTQEEIIEILNQNRNPGSDEPAYITNLVTRPSFSYLANLTSQQQQNRAYKKLHPVIYHDESSVSFVNYLYYLSNGMVKK